MNSRRKVFAAIFIVAAVVVGVLMDSDLVSSAQQWISGKAESAIDVSFIDVGQGLSVLVTSGGEALLYDTGDSKASVAIQTELEHMGVKNLKYMVLSHPHADHIGSAADIIDKLPVGLVIAPKLAEDEIPTSAAYRKMLESIADNKVAATTAKEGATYSLGGTDNIKIVKASTKYKDYNNKSIVMTVSVGNRKLLLTGDAEDKILEELVGDKELYGVSVVQTPHHGSNTSTCNQLWEDIKPAYGVISCGKGNRYMHPHKEVLDLYDRLGVNTLRTDRLGTVRIRITAGGVELR